MLYFDHSATTPIHPDVQLLINELNQDIYGNPSSVHAAGRKAKYVVETARKQIANTINCDPKEIIFTGGGSEANNLVLWNMIYRDRKHVITSSIEHPAILTVLQQLEHLSITHTVVPVNKYGCVNPEDIDSAIKDDTGLITIMMANNEVGTVEPLQDIAKIAKKHDVLLHSDGVQVLGKLPIDVQKLGVDMMSFSAHKFYGPKGVGALFYNKNISPIMYGGNQEKSIRPGTLAVPLIVGFGKACEIAQQIINHESKKILELRNMLLNKILDQYPDTIINGDIDKRIPGNLNLSFPILKGQSIVTSISKIAISSGSACTSSSPKPSHVLSNIGQDKKTSNSSIRIGIGRFNTKDEILIAAEDIINSIKNKTNA